MQQEAPAGALWTRDFTIITIGTVVSMLGNAVSSFAAGLLVLDYTDSTLLYAVFMGFFTLPQILTPLLAGPFLDRFSRKKVIYTLDFCSSGLYALVAAALFLDFFNYPAYLAFSFTVGAIQSLYTVAYESFYPTL
ncbi:MAG TPA: MFS transporter, partial [Oscillospiraceae bacterium]|nr:MFS transporter [Oscillospiraceae bacterium]